MTATIVNHVVIIAIVTVCQFVALVLMGWGRPRRALLIALGASAIYWPLWFVVGEVRMVVVAGFFLPILAYGAFLVWEWKRGLGGSGSFRGR